MDIAVVDPQLEARERTGGVFDVRVLEPSPPAVDVAPWFADDPVAVTTLRSGVEVVAPVSSLGKTWDQLAHEDPGLADWCAERWLGAWRPLAPARDLDVLARTRTSWHALAEHVLTPARHRVNAKIGLRYTRAGFGTPFFGANEQVRVAGTALVVVRGDHAETAPITTVGAAAEAAGIPAGAPTDLFTPTTPLEPDAPLPVDVDAAALLGDWLGFGCSVLEELRAGADRDDAPARVQLWPEHFDLSVDLGNDDAGARVTFGASPGDNAHPEPYVYATPWKQQPDDPTWNDSAFHGASLPLSELASAPDQRAAALGLFARVRARLAS